MICYYNKLLFLCILESVGFESKDPDSRNPKADNRNKGLASALEEESGQVV